MKRKATVAPQPYDAPDGRAGPDAGQADATTDNATTIATASSPAPPSASGATASLTAKAITIAFIAGLEGAWLYALLHVANQGLHLAAPVAALFLVYAASLVWMLILRVLIHSPLMKVTLSWVAWPPATFLFLLGTFHSLSGIGRAPEATTFIVLAAGALWGIGGRLGGTPVTRNNVLIEFQFGLIMLAAALLIGYVVQVDLSGAIPMAVFFVGLGLIAAALTGSDGGSTPLFLRRGGTWWGMLLTGLAVVLLLGLIAGVLFTPELMHLVGRGLHGLWRLIERLFGAIAGLFPSSDPEPLPTPGLEVPPPQESEPGFSLSLPEWIRRPSSIAYGVLFAGLALAAIWSIASQLLERMRRTTQGRAEMEWLRGAFRHDVAGLLRRAFAWVTGLFRLVRRRLKPRDEYPQTASIRRLYADMLRWGAAWGFPRKPCQTPFEYQETLCLSLPGYEREVKSLTEGYVRARYGAQPPTEVELRRLRESRSRLKRP